MAKIVTFNDYRIGMLTPAGVVDLSPSLPDWRPDPTYVNHFISHYSELAPQMVVTSSDALPVDDVDLLPPVPRPTHVLAAPLNFLAHREEMTGPLTSGGGTANELGFFLKAAGSVTRPTGPVLLPRLGRRVDFEGEIAVVIGRRAQGVSPGDALAYVFGYTIMLDITLRMTETAREERTMRKSFASFSPMGPCVVTADDVPDPAALTIRVWRNGELRQDASLKDLIVGVPELISRASHVLPLEPGDVYLTGSPAGVGQLSEGDELVVEVPQIGRMTLPVRTRDW